MSYQSIGDVFFYFQKNVFVSPDFFYYLQSFAVTRLSSARTLNIFLVSLQCVVKLLALIYLSFAAIGHPH